VLLLVNNLSPETKKRDYVIIHRGLVAERGEKEKRERYYLGQFELGQVGADGETP